MQNKLENILHLHIIIKKKKREKNLHVQKHSAF